MNNLSYTRRFAVSRCRTGSLLLVFAAFSMNVFAANPDEHLVIVTPPRQGIDPLRADPKLSASLTVTKAANGTLVGSDSIGHPVIACSLEAVRALHEKHSLNPIDAAGSTWKPVTDLKISYAHGEKPNADDLTKLGLRLVEDYEKGDFMTVEPLNRRIDSALLDKLERHEKVQHVAPSVSIPVAQ